MTQPSGWYDDPSDPNRLRYWDGVLWSEKTMPKLAPGLSHVGEAIPESERVKTEPTVRRDGEPREYDAHWGPEGIDSRQSYGAPRLGGHDPRGQRPFGPNQAGYPNGPAQPGRGPGQIAGLGARFGAALIDYLLISVLSSMAALLLDRDWYDAMQAYVQNMMTAAQSGGQMPSMPDAAQPPLLALVLPIVLILLYDFGCTAFGGRTVGKLMFGLRVVPAEAGQSTHTKVSVPAAAKRTLLKWGAEVLRLTVLSPLAWLIELAVLVSGNRSPKKQGVHDRAAKTVVRRTR